MKYRFYFHYNKIQTLKEGKPQVSVHVKQKCHIVDNVICNVPTFGKINKTQPKFVVQGKAEKFEIRDNVMYIS